MATRDDIILGLLKEVREGQHAMEHRLTVLEGTVAGALVSKDGVALIEEQLEERREAKKHGRAVKTQRIADRPALWFLGLSAVGTLVSTGTAVAVLIAHVP